MPTFGTVVSRGRTNATQHPSYKSCVSLWESNPGRKRRRWRPTYLTTQADPYWQQDGSGYSHRRHHVALSQWTLFLTRVDWNPGKTISHTKRPTPPKSGPVIPGGFRNVLVASWLKLQIINANGRTNFWWPITINKILMAYYNYYFFFDGNGLLL